MKIAIIGSAGDVKLSKKNIEIAIKIGKDIAERGDTLLFGMETDCISLPTIAGQSCKDNGGVSIGFAIGTGKEIFSPESANYIINTGGIIGGGRELSLVLSADKVIMINGGSGTLNEAMIAYQAGIPIEAVVGTGGWADKLAGTYIDSRKRYKVKKITNL